MKCPKCGANTAVKDGAKADAEIYRRRHCVSCGHKFYTIEFEVENNAEFHNAWITYHREYQRRQARKKNGKIIDT